MPRHLTLLTGATRGLGAAIAMELLHEPSNVVLCLSRGGNPALDAQARASGATLEQWPMDLAAPLEAAARVEAWLGTQDAAAFDSATLINNAAALTRVGPLDGVAGDELSRALRVGLEAPLLLCAAFLRATAGWRAERRLLNISSGLGRRAMAGQAAYCAIKAGLDHASRAIALDEALRPRGAKVVSLAPGVIDTDMQAQLRAADASAFPEHGLFVQLKSAGRLSAPQDTARQVLAFLARPDFGSQVIADVREA
jgi:benzil reductase ((S)-benzoin forming)